MFPNSIILSPSSPTHPNTLFSLLHNTAFLRCLPSYNCLRISAFPHLIAASGNSYAAGGSNFTIPPQPEGLEFAWGNHETVVINPVVGVPTFIRLAYSKGFKIGLSSWYESDSTHQRERVILPSDYIRVWNATLHLLDTQNLLDGILWVDVCNEFPVGLWAAPVWKRMFGVPYKNIEAPIFLGEHWDPARMSMLNTYLTGVIPTLRASWPSLTYTFSAQAMGSQNIQRANTTQYDLGEVHIWLCDSMEFMLESLQFTLEINAPTYPENLKLCARASKDLWDKDPGKYKNYLGERVQYWLSWARKQEALRRERGDVDVSFPLITTEGWGPINYAGDMCVCVCVCVYVCVCVCLLMPRYVLPQTREDRFNKIARRNC